MSLVKKWWSGGSTTGGGSSSSGHAKHRNELPSTHTVSGASSSSSASGRKRWPWGDKKTPAATAATEAACAGVSSSDNLDAVLREAGVQGLLAIIAGTWVTGKRSGGGGGWVHAVITSDGFVADGGNRRLLHASPEGGLSLPSSAEASVSDAVAGDACNGNARHATSAVLSQSTRRELAWADGTVWRRADENDVVAVPAPAAAAAAPEAGEAPVSLRVTCYDKHEVDGVYTRLVAEAGGEPAVHNGAPVYVSGTKRLYTGAAGYWMFSSALKMSKDLAVVSSAEPHGGLHPDQLRSWEYYQKPPRRTSTTSSGSSSGGSQPGDSPTPQWQPCTLLSIERLTPPHTAVPAAAAAGTTLAAPTPSQTQAAAAAAATPAQLPPQPSAEETRLILDVFFATSGAEPPGARTQQKVIDDLAAYAAASSSPLPPLVAALCARASVSDPLWRGAPLDVLRKNAQHYVFQCFFARYAKTEMSTADRLFDDVCVAGRFTREQALRSVCQRFQEAQASYGDWEGDYPVGVRHGFDPRRRGKQVCLLVQFVVCEQRAT